VEVTLGTEVFGQATTLGIHRTRQVRTFSLNFGLLSVTLRQGSFAFLSIAITLTCFSKDRARSLQNQCVQVDVTERLR
jgi:hypothetical protein